MLPSELKERRLTLALNVLLFLVVSVPRVSTRSAENSVNNVPAPGWGDEPSSAPQRTASGQVAEWGTLALKSSSGDAWADEAPSYPSERRSASDGWGTHSINHTVRGTGLRRSYIPASGDWECSHCHLINYRRREFCHGRNCGKPREANDEAGSPSHAPKWGDAGDAQSSPKSRSTGWRSPQHSARAPTRVVPGSTYASVASRRPATKRAQSAPAAWEQPASSDSNATSSTEAGQHGSTASDGWGNGTRGDTAAESDDRLGNEDSEKEVMGWDCAHCHIWTSRYKKACSRCKAPRPTDYNFHRKYAQSSSDAAPRAEPLTTSLRPDSREFTPPPLHLSTEGLSVPALVDPPHTAPPVVESTYAPMPPLTTVAALPPPPESLHMWQRALALNADLRRYLASFPGSPPPYLYTLMANQQLLLRQLAAFLCLHYPALLGAEASTTQVEADYLQNATLLQSFAAQLLSPVPFSTPLPDAPRWLRIPSRLPPPADPRTHVARPLLHAYSYLVERWGSQELLPQAPLQPLPASEFELVTAAWAPPSRTSDAVARIIEGVALTYADLARLDPDTEPGAQRWVNDSLVDAYLQLLMKWCNTTGQLMPSRAPRVLALSSHFIPKLTGGGLSYEFGAVSKWTARTPLLDYDKLLFPVCVTRAHWTLVLANLTRQQLEVLDSSNDASLVNYLVHPVRRLLHDEVSARPHKRFSTAVMDWPVVRCDADSALAQCHDDCGVFVMRAAVLRTLDLTLDFGASDLRIVRERIAFELLHDALDICVLDLQGKTGTATISPPSQ